MPSVGAGGLPLSGAGFSPAGSTKLGMALRIQLPVCVLRLFAAGGHRRWVFPADGFRLCPTLWVSRPSGPAEHGRCLPSAVHRSPRLASESDFALQRLPFSGVSHFVRHTRPAMGAERDHSGSPGSLDASVFERAVHSDPAAVSGHLAICGAPTGACQPLRCCWPADKFFTRLICFTFVTARSSLCLRSVRFVTSSDPRLDSR